MGWIPPSWMVGSSPPLLDDEVWGQLWWATCPTPTEDQPRLFHSPRRTTWTHRLLPHPRACAGCGPGGRWHSWMSCHTGGTAQNGNSGKRRIKSSGSTWGSPNIKIPISLGSWGWFKNEEFDLNTASALGSCEHWLGIWGYYGIFVGFSRHADGLVFV